jgi:hypothetical protein
MGRRRYCGGVNDGEPEFGNIEQSQQPARDASDDSIPLEKRPVWPAPQDGMSSIPDYSKIFASFATTLDDLSGSRVFDAALAAGRSRGQTLAQAEFVSNSRWHRESMLFQGGCPRAEGGDEPYAVGLVSVDRA